MGGCGTQFPLSGIGLTQKHAGKQTKPSAQCRTKTNADGGLGGCCQWVLDSVCKTVECSNQPLGFNSLALLISSRLKV
jgi:hypothetical protein